MSLLSCFLSLLYSTSHAALYQFAYAEDNHADHASGPSLREQLDAKPLRPVANYALMPVSLTLRDETDNLRVGYRFDKTREKYHGDRYGVCRRPVTSCIMLLFLLFHLLTVDLAVPIT